MVALRSSRTDRVLTSAAADGAAIVVNCLRCRHEATLSAAELATYGVKPDSPIAGFVRRLRCKECGSGSVLAKRIAKRPSREPPRQRHSA